jgi:N-acetylmuramoyl-L-alanine amidase
VKATWLIPSLLSCSLLTPALSIHPAMAEGRLDGMTQTSSGSPHRLAQASRGQLTTWSVSPDGRQLQFKTNQGVQPRARLIFNPTRLVIDLPGMRLGRPPFSQSLSGRFKVLKGGQFDPGTARLVIQLDSGYTLDPNAIEFQGLNPSHWIVKLPAPQRQQGGSRTAKAPTSESPPRNWRPGAILEGNDNDNDPSNEGFGRYSQIRGNTTWAGSANDTVLEAVDLNGRQLLIRGSRSLPFTTGWDRNTGAFRISLSAQPERGLRLPPTGGNSPLQSIQLQQEGDSTVLLLYPAAGTRIGTLRQVSDRQLALDLGTTSAPVTPPIAAQPSVNSANEIPISVPPPMTGSVPSTVPPVAQSYPTQPLPTIPNGRRVVVIDPGHGGPDPGAIGIGGIREKDIVIDISRQVAAKLEQQGVGVVLTRSADRDLDLEPRVQIARRVNATIFVSIHANAISMSRPDINGLETYYYGSWSSRRLAALIHRSVLQSTGSRDRGIRSARFYVLRRTLMPASLVEVGFVTGREDSPRLATANYRTLLADSIARGILEYLQNVR